MQKFLSTSCLSRTDFLLHPINGDNKMIALSDKPRILRIDARESGGLNNKDNDKRVAEKK